MEEDFERDEEEADDFLALVELCRDKYPDLPLGMAIRREMGT